MRNNSYCSRNNRVMIEGLSGRLLRRRFADPLLVHRVGLTKLINDVELVFSLKKMT